MVSSAAAEGQHAYAVALIDCPPAVAAKPPPASSPAASAAAERARTHFRRHRGSSPVAAGPPATTAADVPPVPAPASSSAQVVPLTPHGTQVCTPLTTPPSADDAGSAAPEPRGVCAHQHVTQPRTSCSVMAAAYTDGAAAAAADTRTRDKYGRTGTGACSFLIIPLSHETYSRVGPAAFTLLARVADVAAGTGSAGQSIFMHIEIFERAMHRVHLHDAVPRERVPGLRCGAGSRLVYREGCTCPRQMCQSGGRNSLSQFEFHPLIGHSRQVATAALPLRIRNVPITVCMQLDGSLPCAAR